MFTWYYSNLLWGRESELIKVGELDYVDLAANSNNHLTVDLKSHDTGKLYNCAHCEKQFKTRQQLKVHMKTHPSEKSYSCNYSNCGKWFKNKTETDSSHKNPYRRKTLLLQIL